MYLRVFVAGALMFVGVLSFVAWLILRGPTGPGWDDLAEPPLGLSAIEIRERLGEPVKTYELWEHELTAQFSLFLVLSPGPNVKLRRIRRSFVRARDGTGFWKSRKSAQWPGVVESTHEQSSTLVGRPATEVQSLTASAGELRTCWTDELHGADYTQYIDILLDDRGVVVGVLSRTDS